MFSKAFLGRKKFCFRMYNSTEKFFRIFWNIRPRVLQLVLFKKVHKRCGKMLRTTTTVTFLSFSSCGLDVVFDRFPCIQ